MDQLLNLRQENLQLKKRLIETQAALLQILMRDVQAEEAALQQEIAAQPKEPEQPSGDTA